MRVIERVSRTGLLWIAWNLDDDATIALRAYRCGALAVLPAATPPSLLSRHAHGADAHRPERFVSARTNGSVERRLRAGEPLWAARESVIEVRTGALAQSVIHSDGTRVLTGIAGPGQILIAHPSDDCGIVIDAHTNAVVLLTRWDDAASAPSFPDRLLARLQQQEAWAAVQARPHIDDRILGLLGLLAEQFGQPHPQGVLIDLRLTHAQLAMAAGANRTTVTRLLGDLRRAGALLSVGRGAGERHCLPNWSGSAHVVHRSPFERPFTSGG